ncbi:cupin domain-containing protein [Paenibacillus pinisoli]|uniref:Cupin domain-containing protein n=1 Tax=Paenibacillus pinisoli TaxID=1276110 RepID=A0A3A6PCT3_9BACL|nr:cupin domain-containing protein [Paenibacillus pinisoli]RJX37526.1 cupin domain-containing protein [Paenibacillus pinisoli]
MLLTRDEHSWVDDYGIKLQHLFPLLENRDMAPFGSAWARLLPGEISTKHSHRVAELLFITKGEGMVHIDSDTTYQVSEGDVIYLKPNCEHYISNTGKNEDGMILLSIWWESNERLIKHLNTHLLPE